MANPRLSKNEAVLHAPVLSEIHAGFDVAAAKLKPSLRNKHTNKKIKRTELHEALLAWFCVQDPSRQEVIASVGLGIVQALQAADNPPLVLDQEILDTLRFSQNTDGKG